MKPGLKMMMMQPKERMDYDDPNRRRIGFGANENLPRPPRPDDPLDPHRYVPQDPRIFPPEPRRRVDEPHRMMDEDYPDEPEMTYADNVMPIRRYWPQKAHVTHEPKREGEPVRAGGEFWMITPAHEKKLTREKAEHWVRKMARHGEAWSFEDAKRLGAECGVPDDMQSQIDFYAALNMMKSDYHSVAARYGHDDKKFYAYMALAFLHDEDGMPPSEKLAAYYKHVVPQDDE